MASHRHHHPGRYTYAIVLAKLCLDEQAEQIVANRVGDCWQCWKIIAEQLAMHVWGDMLATHGIPELHPSGLVEGRVITAVCGLLAGMIDVAEADARDDGSAA
jgi:hypothetical protein